MAKEVINVSISPKEVMEIIEKRLNDEDVDRTSYDLGDGKSIEIGIYERYFFRSNNRGGLIVTVDNVEGYTKVKLVSTGTSEGVFFNFDWGAGDKYINDIKNILEDYII